MVKDSLPIVFSLFFFFLVESLSRPAQCHIVGVFLLVLTLKGAHGGPLISA